VGLFTRHDNSPNRFRIHCRACRHQILPVLEGGSPKRFANSARPRPLEAQGRVPDMANKGNGTGKGSANYQAVRKKGIFVKCT